MTEELGDNRIFELEDQLAQSRQREAGLEIDRNTYRTKSKALQQERHRLREAVTDALTDSMYSESKRIENALQALAGEKP